MAERCHIAHLTAVHPPFDTRIFHRECQTLVQAGYRVTLCAPHSQDARVDGVTIRALPLPGNRRERLLATHPALWRAAVACDATLYHFHDPELIPLGLWLQRRGKRVVYDVHEDLPRQVRDKFWIPPALRPLMAGGASVAEWAAHNLDGFIAATPGIAARFPGERTVTVQNFPVLGELGAREATPYAARAPLIAYVGSLSAVRGARQMVEAIAALPEALGAKLVLAGTPSPPELARELAALPGGQRTEFTGQLDRPGVRALLAQARIGLVTLQPTASYMESYPVKLFEYMAAGVPVVASDFPLWRTIVHEAGCGLLVDPRDPAAIAEAITRLLADPAAAARMGERGREAVMHRYQWAAEADKLLAFYDRLTRVPQRAGSRPRRFFRLKEV